MAWPNLPTDPNNKQTIRLSDLQEKDWNPFGKGSRHLNNGKLTINGLWDEGVYLNKELSENFRISVTFRTEDPLHEFFLGVSEYNDKTFPSFVLRANKDDYSIAQRFESPKDSNEVIEDYLSSETPGITPHKSFSITYERIDGRITILQGDNIIGSSIVDKSEINQVKYLFFASRYQDLPERGTVIIENFVLEEWTQE